MVRKAFRMELRPGMAEEYQRRHDELWPEMREMIHAYGGRNYSIFLDPATVASAMSAGGAASIAIRSWAMLTSSQFGRGRLRTKRCATSMKPALPGKSF